MWLAFLSCSFYYTFWDFSVLTIIIICSCSVLTTIQWWYFLSFLLCTPYVLCIWLDSYFSRLGIFLNFIKNIHVSFAWNCSPSSMPVMDRFRFFTVSCDSVHIFLKFIIDFLVPPPPQTLVFCPLHAPLYWWGFALRILFDLLKCSFAA